VQGRSTFRVIDFTEMQLRQFGTEASDKSWRLEITLPDQYLKLKANNETLDEDRAELQSWQSAFRRHANHYRARELEQASAEGEKERAAEKEAESPRAMHGKINKWKQRAMDADDNAARNSKP